MEWYLSALEKYATFSGRADRKSYWMYVLVNFLVAFGIGVAAGVSGSKALLLLSNIYGLATLLPSLAVAVRRMHDVNHKGWWLFVPIYSLVLLCRTGIVGGNTYGPDPKQPKTPTPPPVQHGDMQNPTNHSNAA